MNVRMEKNGMANIKQCFTINQHRTTEEFNSYEELIKQGLFQGIEIFYPYDKTEEQKEIYRQNVLNLMKYNIEVVLHLPHGFKSDLLNENEYEVILQRFKDAIDFAEEFKDVVIHSLRRSDCVSQSGKKFFVLLMEATASESEIVRDRIFSRCRREFVDGISFEREATKAYYEEKYEEGMQFAYIYPGINRVLQAGGRVIRREDDYGVLVLIDDRFDDPIYKKTMPSLWRGMKFISDAKTLREELDAFWRDVQNEKDSAQQG